MSKYENSFHKYSYPMKIAPKDGSRILLSCICKHFSGYGRPYKSGGLKIVEGYFNGTDWVTWEGSKKILSTEKLCVKGWWPIEMLYDT